MSVERSHAPGLALVTFRARGHERASPRAHAMWVACAPELAAELEAAIARDKARRRR